MSSDAVLSIWDGTGWAEAGAVEPGGFRFATPGGQLPDAVIGPLEWSVTITVPASRQAFTTLICLLHAGCPPPLSRRPWTRCPQCNPDGNPPRLPGDGHEYHRRQKARKKRRR